MTRSIDDDLAALARQPLAPSLDGLEDRVWTQVQARKAAARANSLGVGAALTLAALGLGLAFGALHREPAPSHLSEMGVLSEDGLLAPSIRLGGGA
jgi:hypothetical protein